MGASGESRAARERRLVPLLAAFCLLLTTLEFVIPKPLPFLRLGVANLPLLLAVPLLSFRPYLLLVLLKILGMALVSGTLLSYVFIFSFAGSMGAGLTMFAGHRLFGRHISFLGLSVLGAAVSNGLQVLLALQWVFGEGAQVVAPPFLLVGLLTSLALGVFAEQFQEKSGWYRRMRLELAP